jgi:hypothetical protein
VDRDRGDSARWRAGVGGADLRGAGAAEGRWRGQDSPCKARRVWWLKV